MIFLAAILMRCAIANAATPIARELPRSDSQPFFLVASPDMPDPTFQQTVILMLPSAELPIVAGIIVNKPSKMTLAQLFNESADFRKRTEPIYFGGPVELTTPIVLLRSSKVPDGAARLFQNVYMSVDANSIAQILKRSGSEKDARLFLGRAQWSVDQLHGEMLRGAWTVSPASPDFVFSADPVTVWPALAKQGKLRQVEELFDGPPDLHFCVGAPLQSAFVGTTCMATRE